MRIETARAVDVDWRERGACFGTFDDRFFAGARAESRTRGTGLANRRRQKEAEAVCATCPVKIACRIYAVENDVTAGTWGGRTR